MDNNHNGSIKFQLRIYNNIGDISNMLNNCETLLQIRYITKLDNSDIININESSSEYIPDISRER